MKKIHDYECSHCGYIFEELGGNTFTCPKCSNLANKIISTMNFRLEGVSGDFPTAADKWEKDHVRSAKHRQGREDWGDPIL